MKTKATTKKKIGHDIKAIILAAGRSTRTWPLTVNRPKPLLKIIDKTIIEHNLIQLKGIVKEVIIVVGFMKEEIKKLLGDTFDGITLRYINQEKQLGTGDAVLRCKKFLNNSEKLLILAGDDLYSAKDINALIKKKEGALATEVDCPDQFGIFKLDRLQRVQDLIEKPESSIGNLANNSCYLVSSEIIDFLEDASLSKRGEIELTSAILEYAKNKKRDFFIIKTKDYWFPIAYPWNYLEANVFFLNRIREWKNQGRIEKNVTIERNVWIGKGTIIKSGTYIEGPAYIGKECIIGPGAYIRKDTVIMDKVTTRAEIYDSVIMDNSTAKHNCYIGHSVIGKNVNIGAGTITSDYRHDGSTHTTLIKGKKIATKRRKLGAFIGDNVKTGIGTLIYPGRKLWPDTTTVPGEIVTKDKLY
jgi:UDP-N-acetylglucosamine diphosphorylase / glucose-1-phosphate thymidylyltransferase / UDP-N-acetylgalactosamine diphosphorylase / glucosamine-1-phosphate N-acetyltransferase / galactosamine-1-phosphate N-acetyltransferase